MAEYIEREAAMLTPVLPKEYRQYQTGNLDDAYEQGWEDALNNLKNAPAADAAPVVHGRWIGRPLYGTDNCRCSECGSWFDVHVNPRGEAVQKYCPNCGAKMDGGEIDG